MVSSFLFFYLTSILDMPNTIRDIPNIQKTFPFLQKGAPSSLQTLVRPTQVLCASGVGMKIKFSAFAKSDFESKYNSHLKVGGCIKIFNFNIGLGGSHESGQQSQQMKHQYDSNSGTLTIEPRDLSGTCTVLAVMGTKLEIK
jgi:hypothetical protein